MVGVLVAIGTLRDAAAQSVANGRALFNATCAGCHTTNPATAGDPYNLILTAANTPSQITYASSLDPLEMGFIQTTLSPSDLVDLAAFIATLPGASPGPPPPLATVTVVEYYDAAQDHYFITAAPAEISDLDNSVHAGWQRTGQTFKAFAGLGDAASPVCRFYIPPEQGDSHFYSASPAECADVRAKFPTFVYEAPDVFYEGLPDQATGACPAGTVPVYRAWDSRVDSNHRYTVSLTIRQQMIDAGWVAEGYGPNAVIMCAPA